VSARGQFALLAERRFAPLFWVQFLGAANDNLFKFAFTLLATYAADHWGRVDPHLAGFLIAGLFVAPFMLFSATSGQLADKLEKSWFIRRIKDAEIAIMLIGAAGLLLQLAPLLYLAIFLLGLQSAVFGPVKYSYLPQHLDVHEVTGGNGLVEMGTFVAILFGTIGGGVLIGGFSELGALATASAALFIALLGRGAAQFVPVSPAADPGLTINWNPFTETWTNLRLAHGSVAVFNSIIGISWLWFFGSIFLTSFTPYARSSLGGDESVVTFLLAVFSVGIGIGSLACERLSGRRVEIGLVPLGSIGMTVFALDLYFASAAFRPMTDGALRQFLAQPRAWRIVIDLASLALFAGLYSVPLYALIQTRADRTRVARIVAANNILNALFMVIASLFASALLASGLTIPQLFFVTALMNAAVAIYIYRLVPEFLLRFLAWVLAHTLYRVRSINTDSIPTEGAAVLACNHVSFVDAVLIMGESPRPIRFVMDHRIFKIPLMNWFFRTARAIAIAPAHEDPEMLARANDRIDAALADGDLVCIFPEGKITYDGELGAFKQGVQKIVERAPAPVYPMALRGLWGSFFSRYGGAAFSRPVEARLRRGLRSKVELIVGDPLPADQVTPERLMARVAALRGDDA
jgi:1-acyl-sn-glycerol-3-phosphate acyltransferase